MPTATGSGSSTGSTARRRTGPGSSSGPRPRTATSGTPSGRAATRGCCSPRPPDGEPLATLFLVRCGPRVVEPYGGMTVAGGDSRANYLLKWEAIRSSREAGATSYDLWGLATGGIAHFKAGFGGREVHYIGAWDLVLDRLGRTVYDTGPARTGLAGPAPPRARYGGQRRDVRGDRVTETVREATAGRARGLGRPGRRCARRSRLPVRRPGRTTEPRPAGGRGSSSRPDGGRVLALERDWPMVGGSSAYIPRGPVAGRDGGRRRCRRASPGRLIEVSDALAAERRRRRGRRCGGSGRRSAATATRSGPPGSSRSRRSSRRGTGSRSR